MFHIQKFRETYKSDPMGVAFCPYRVCPVGAHSDYQCGKITGLVIDKGISIAYRPKQNGVIELISLQFDKRAQWHIAGTPKEKRGDWADYLRGATMALAKKHPLSLGICGVIEGSMPIGGLSSSAAVTIAFISALCKVNNIMLSEQEMVMIALSAEVDYVGVSVGKTDPSCEVFSKKDHLLYLDTYTDTYELIPTPKNMKPYKIAVFFSGLERSLVGTNNNMRVDECRSAAYALKAYAGMEYGNFKDANLRDVPYDIYLAYKDRLPENWAKRAQHWYGEQERVQKGADAWRKGNIEEYGRLSFESGMSSIENWQTGSPELKKLYDIMTKTDGIYGGRFSGAGHKGCCMALVDPAFEESIKETVTKEYLAAFPELADKFAVYFCESADGAVI